MLYCVERSIVLARILGVFRAGGEVAVLAAATTANGRPAPASVGRPEPGPYRVAPTTHHERRPAPSRECDAAPSSTADGDVTPLIHAALQDRDLLPATHIVDTGFLDAQLLVTSRQDHDVDLLGPTRLDYHWQARERNGFAAEHFRIDWARREATCPEGHTSASWTPSTDRVGEWLTDLPRAKSRRTAFARLIATG